MQNYFFYGTGEILTSKYRKDIFEKFLNLHIGYFDIKENSPGALLTRLTSDTTKITGIATSILGQILQTIVTLCIGMIVSFFYQWIICAINIAFMPLIIGSYYLQFSLNIYLKNEIMLNFFYQKKYLLIIQILEQFLYKYEYPYNN